jgi:hypothetical protein
MEKTRRKLTPEEQKKKDADMVEAFAQFEAVDGDYWLLQDFDDDALRAAWEEIGNEQKKKKKGTSK